MLNFAKIRNHSINIIGPRTKRKIIAFDSDDWGSIKIPTEHNYKQLTKSGIGLNDYYLKYDNLETKEDLEVLFNCFSKFSDINGNPPVITANFVMANPDYYKLKQNGFNKYYHRPIKDIIKEADVDDEIINLWKKGIAEKYFIPQLHAREHVDIARWMRALQNKDEIAHLGFENFYAVVGKTKDSSKRDGVNASFDFESYIEIESFETIISDAVRLFADLFGKTPETFIAPAYTWHRDMERQLKKHGITFIQTLAFQTEPRPNSKKKYKSVFHYMGQKNKHGQSYILRNCFFEPTILHQIDWVDNCLKRIEIAFKYQKPAIIGIHRLNFIGSRVKENREKNIKLLTKLLLEIQRKWPDVEFMSVDEVGKLLNGKCRNRD